MMKSQIIYITFLFVTITSGYAQNAVNNTIAQEEIYVHINSGVLFSGEYLYYQLYCLNAQTHKKSTRSNIAYVELIDSNKEVVFNHKIILNEGLGDGDFFVPSTIPSGNYKLIAYTRWMLNNPKNKFFEASLKIINPYVAEINNTQEIESIKFPKSTLKQKGNLKTSENLNIKIVLDKQKLSTREKLNVTLQNNMGVAGNGDYSMSIRKVDDIEGFARITAKASQSKRARTKIIVIGNNNIKPETDGYLFTGKVTRISSQLPAQSVDVAISIPGENFFFAVATTNADGEFSFEIDEDFQGEQAIVQIVEDVKNDFEITLSTRQSPDYSKLNFPEFYLNQSVKEKIIERSIYNQIENGYYNLKPDTIIEKSPAVSFVRYEKGVTYDLDDYTRFNTMKEVFTEIVRLAWTTTIDGTRVVKVLEQEMSEPTPYVSLLFVDGVFYENHEEFLSIAALDVQTIKVIRKGYFFGKKEYQGVIIVTTKKGDYLPNTIQEFQMQQALFLPQPSKRYFSQSYNISTIERNKRIPDYRLQLLWNSKIRLMHREYQNILYTSDIPGRYEIVVEGFTEQGIPISLREIFEVEGLEK